MTTTDPGARACSGYEAPMEEYLEALQEDSAARPAPELARHLAACAECRGALDEVREVSALVRESALRAPAALLEDPYFAVRAAARARESLRRGGDFWRLLEAFSLRFTAAALAVALMLGAMAVWGPQRSSAQTMVRLLPVESALRSPEASPARGSADDVVAAMLSPTKQRSGRQR